jgi:hypothetical protein
VANAQQKGTLYLLASDWPDWHDVTVLVKLMITSLCFCPCAQAAKLDSRLRLSIVRPWQIGREHLAVAVDHELRAMESRFLAPIAAFFRVLVAFLMVGEVEEYRDVSSGGRLVAWSQTVCKGKTARGQWFYQRTEWSKNMICQLACVFSFSFELSSLLCTHHITQTHTHTHTHKH